MPTDGAAVLAGGCHCGAVRYEARGTPFHESLCHCADCRRVAGAPVVAWFSVARDAFTVVQGAPRLYASSPGVERGFCGDCGTPLTFVTARAPDEIDVATATLDDPAAVPPKDHLWVASGLPWMAPCDGLPRFAGTRSEG